MELGNMALTELLDIGYLQLLQDSFARVTGLSTALFSPDGVPLTEASLLPELRGLLDGNSRVRERIRAVGLRLLNAARDSGEAAREVFSSSGIFGLAVPFALEGRIIGCWVSGCAFPEDSPDPDCDALAAEYSLDANLLRAVFSKLPRFSNERFESAASFLSAVSGTIAQLIHYNLITLESNKELELHGERLEHTAADRKSSERQLVQMAFYDGTLHLPNARKLAADLREQGHRGAFLLCFDTLRLRKINDVYGRATGDILLRAVSGWLAGLSPNNTELYRFEDGGFCLLLRDSGSEAALSLAARMRARFELPWELDVDAERLNLFCEVSIGVVDAGAYAGDFDGLRGVIERTLVSAKNSGGVAVYDEALDSVYREHVLLEMSLKDCVRDGMRGFEVYYQPIVDSVTGAWCALEALCRWTSPELGPVSPLIFIHEAEHHGPICAIGYWVLETAVRQCKQWGLDERENFLLNVNLSPAELDDECLVETTAQILARYDYPPGRLNVEITGSSEINLLSGRTLKVIENLRALGVILTLADFDFGYASFENLKKLPAVMLKAEEAFFRNIENDAFLRNLLRMSVELAHTAGMNVIAEGVETPGQLGILMGSGVDCFQGYLFGWPMPAASIEPMLAGFCAAGDIFLRARKELRNMRALLGDRGDYALLPENYRLLSGSLRLAGAGDPGGALAFLGKELRLGRVLLFSEDASGCFDCRAEWFADGFEAMAEDLQNIDFRHDIPEWTQMLEGDGAICASNIAALPETVAQFLALCGLLSAVVLPAFDGGALCGFICYANCRSRREWPPETILLLSDVTAVIAGARRPAWPESN